MVTYEELNVQNHKITELSNVLLYLLSDRSMCDTETACTLFYNYLDKVRHHLKDVDHLYNHLLADERQDVNNTARMFMSGEQELKKLISGYERKWCDRKSHGLHVADHQRFLADTRDVFEMVLRRIQDETERLYPLVRRVSGDHQNAA